ncbi:MAG: Uma2 family endonuclease [Deltaproteobacteria bacterium]|nr:Uma2 family endonuclease [Deltaproteobacteria bacterium]
MQPLPLVSAAEYLVMERSCREKHEYFAGEVFAMGGATESHNLLTANVVGGLWTQLRGRPCRVYPSDLRVLVSETGLYTYPDVVVVCGEPRFLDATRDTLLNPTLVVEVLSPSSEACDRGRKFEHYRKVPSLLEYVLVAQDAVRGEHYLRRDDGTWVYAEASGLEKSVALTSIQCTVSLADLYDNVNDLPLAPSPPAPP